VAAAAGCAGSGPAVVPLPGPAPADAALCARLHAQLPAKVGTHARRDVKPRSEFSAAWGDPPVVLLCGVPRPAGLRGSGTAPVGINGVAWLQEAGRDTVDYTAVDRGVFVRVEIPKRYAGQSSIPIDLSNAVSAALPARPIPQ
jgi:Protein of unknown function (DUF3515)